MIALADRERVRQIIRILLDNALTHTPEGTEIIRDRQFLQPTAAPS